MTLTIPNSFTGGKKAKATAVNENFTTCADAINTNLSSINDINDTLDTCIKNDGSVDFERPQAYQKLAITDATWATPIVLEVVEHGLQDDDVAYIDEVGGNTSANGKWTLKREDDDHVALYYSDGTESAGNAEYTSGGYLYLFAKDNEDLVTKLELDKATQRANYFTIVSGNTDDDGNADLFQASIKTVTSTPNMTSDSQESYIVSQGDYQVFNTGLNYVANGHTDSGTLIAPSKIYATGLKVGKNLANSYYMATSVTVTLYNDDSLVWTKTFNPRALANTTIPIDDIEWNKMVISNAHGSPWSSDGGGNGLNGMQIVGYTLTETTLNPTLVKFKVGSDYDNLVVCHADGTIEEISKLANVTSLGNGTNYFLKQKGKNDIFVTTSKVTQGSVYPTSPADGDFHCDTSKGIETYKYETNEWVSSQYIPLGVATVEDGIITSIKAYAYNNNGYDINVFTDEHFVKYYVSDAYTIALGTQINVTHNLNLTDPKKAIYIPFLICTTDCEGYVVGDVIDGPLCLSTAAAYDMIAPVIATTNSLTQVVGDILPFDVPYKAGTTFMTSAEIIANFKYHIKIIY